MSVSAVGSTSLDQLTLAQMQADQQLQAEDEARRVQTKTENAAGVPDPMAPAAPSAKGSPQGVDVTV